MKTNIYGEFQTNIYEEFQTNIYGEFHPDLVSAGKEAITKLTQFWVFGGDKYESGNGMSDFRKSFSVLEEAKAFADGFVCGNSCKYALVWDSQGGNFTDHVYFVTG